jgi:hypothetical protein
VEWSGRNVIFDSVLGFTFMSHGRAEAKQEKPQSVSQSLGSGMNPGPHDYEVELLPT